jgi:2-keto-4-pentenoate hydratase/2-oxohepta-3-ene-1,7-dioic acid hydratase in catechol pathway
LRWASFADPVDGAERCGVVQEGLLVAAPAGVALVDLVAGGADHLVRQGELVLEGLDDRYPTESVQLLAPIPRPPSVRDFYAFEQHVKTARAGRGLEMDPDWYELPVFYFSNPSALVGHGAAVSVPPGSAELDFELEVAAVIGPGGTDLSVAEAERHIAGYTVMNDWSARDIQRREMKLGLGPAKGKDFATSLGPWLVTPDELSVHSAGSRKAFDLTMTASVNGREYSRASLADIHWSFAEMVAYASRSSRVVAGDVIGSGTCGTGCILELSLVHGSAAYPWLRPGDQVALEVEGLGRLANAIQAH